MVARRRNFAIARRFLGPGRIVCLDKTGAKTNMTRLYGPSPVGQRCVDATPHGHWQTMTLLSAIRGDGVIRDATLWYDGAMNAPTFLDYTRQCLAPSLRPGDVVVMDNLTSHKTADVIEAIEAVGGSVWYLPPYSPDLNPIEKMWSKVKAWLRDVAAATVEGLVDATADALCDVTPSQCLNYFRSCGYCQ